MFGIVPIAKVQEHNCFQGAGRELALLNAPAEADEAEEERTDTKTLIPTLVLGCLRELASLGVS